MISVRAFSPSWGSPCQLNRSAVVAEGLLDELVCYWAPKLFGSDARPMFDLAINTIDAHLALSIKDIRQIGEDLRITLYPDKDY